MTRIGAPTINGLDTQGYRDRRVLAIFNVCDMYPMSAYGLDLI
jgi:hypothetical protein